MDITQPEILLMVRKLRSRVLHECTLCRLKYLHATKLTCTNCVIHWPSAKLGSKKEIEICKYNKYDVSALTWVKISNFFGIPWGVNLLIY